MPTEIRSQDVAFVLIYLMWGEQQALVWDWIEANWPELVKRQPANLLARSLSGITTVTDPDLAKRIRAFVEANPVAVGLKTVTQYMELMDTTVAFARAGASGAGEEVRVVARPFAVDTAPPPGRELYRFATVNDVHIGEDGFGAFREMHEPDDVAVPYPVRCLRAAVHEAVEWGAQRIIAKGDLTDEGQPNEFDRRSPTSSPRPECPST